LQTNSHLFSQEIPHLLLLTFSQRPVDLKVTCQMLIGIAVPRLGFDSWGGEIDDSAFRQRFQACCGSIPQQPSTQLILGALL